MKLLEIFTFNDWTRDILYTTRSCSSYNVSHIKRHASYVISITLNFQPCVTHIRGVLFSPSWQLLLYSNCRLSHVTVQIQQKVNSDCKICKWFYSTLKPHRHVYYIDVCNTTPECHSVYSNWDTDVNLLINYYSFWTITAIKRCKHYYINH